MAECKRVFRSKAILGLLVFLVALNVFLFVYQCRETGYDMGEYRAVYLEELKRYQAMTPEGALADLAAREEDAARWNTLSAYRSATDPWLRELLGEQCAEAFGPDFEARLEAGTLTLPEAEDSALRQEIWGVLREQLNHLAEYPGYLDTVHQNARQMSAMSIFYGENSFSSRNIQKTDGDFPEAVEIRLDNDLAITKALGDNLPSYSALVFMTALALCFVQERKRGLWSLIYGSRAGRSALALRRIFLMLLGAVLATVTIAGGRLLTAALVYGGLGDLSRNVQSISIFRGLPEVMTLGQFLLYDLLFRIVGMSLLGLILWAVLQAVSNLQLAIVAAGLLLGAEYAVFTLIPDSYSLVILRYVNLFALVDIPRIFLRYLNLNLFGHAVRGCGLTLMLLAPGLLGAGAACVALQAKKRPVSSPNPLLRLFGKLQKPVSWLLGRLRLFGLEVHKLLWQQRGALVLLAAVIWMVWYLDAPPVDTQLYDTGAAAYEIQYQGLVTQDTLDSLRQELERLKLREDSFGVGETMESLTGLISRVEGMLAEGGDHYLVNPVPYAALMNANSGNAQRSRGLFLMLFLVLGLSGLFAFENQSRMTAQLRSSPSARRLWRKKMTLAATVALLLWLVFTARELTLIGATYSGFGGLRAPMGSLAMFEPFSWALPLWAALLGYLLLRLLVLLCLAMGICALSLCCPGQNQALLVNAAVFLLPAALASLGIPLFDRISILRLLSPMECGMGSYILCALFGTAALLCSRPLWLRLHKA